MRLIYIIQRTPIGAPQHASDLIEAACERKEFAETLLQNLKAQEPSAEFSMFELWAV